MAIILAGFSFWLPFALCFSPFLFQSGTGKERFDIE